MSKVIRLAALYPEHLNLNGDLANLTVLRKRLEWAGIDSEIVSIHKPTDLTSFDVVLLGHGSRDAWAQLGQIDPQLVSKVADLIRTGKRVLAVSSGYEQLIEVIENRVVKHNARVSEFQEHEGIVGYVNSEAELEPVLWMENSLLTLLHGPVFAKNPDLADKFLGDLIGGAGNSDDENFSRIAGFAEASRKIAFED